LAERRWEDLEQAVRGLEKAGAGMDARVFRARRSLAQEDFAAARRILDETVAHFPHELWPRRILSHVLLQEGRDWAAAARALRDVLALDPRDTEAQNNLNVLLQQHAAEVSEPRNDLRPVP
jgi:Tfp pilus assembly protein PilF